MKNLRLICAIVLGFICLAVGCVGNKSVIDFVKEGGLETKGLVNLALASNGATVTVSEDNPDHPAPTLINGIASSENWNQGEGWELKYEGRFARGGYVGYGVEDPGIAADRGFDESYDPGDSSWRGLTMQTRLCGSVNTALGWIIIEFPEEKTVNRAIINTINSDEYSAEQFGVRDLMIQYWSNAANSWAVVERIGKGKGRAGNTIQDNKSDVMTLRFQPVKTSKMRFVVRWTNDSKSYRRGYCMNAIGTIRLLEIEIYGYEREKADEEGKIVSATGAGGQNTAPIQDANEIAKIEIVIDNYVEGYNRRNVDMLMSSISPDYSKDGEAYSDLKKRMESIFAKYGRVKLELKNVKTTLTNKGATTTSSYTAQYESTADGSPPVNASGVLVFELSNTSGYWKITLISSQ